MTQITQGVRRTTMPAATKFLGNVGEREIKVIASDSTPDRMGDVLEPAGCDLTNYRRNPVVLAQHDANQPIGRCSRIGIEGTAVVATIQFPAEGVSAKADEYCRLMKAGVVSAVSVGFLPKSWTPLSSGGLRFKEWELLELSAVSIPANPSALVTAKAFGSTDRARDLARAARIVARISGSPQPVEEIDAATRETDFQMALRRAEAVRLHQDALHRHALAVQAAMAGPSW